MFNQIGFKIILCILLSTPVLATNRFRCDLLTNPNLHGSVNRKGLEHFRRFLADEDILNDFHLAVALMGYAVDVQFNFYLEYKTGQPQKIKIDDGYMSPQSWDSQTRSSFDYFGTRKKLEHIFEEFQELGDRTLIDFLADKSVHMLRKVLNFETNQLAEKIQGLLGQHSNLSEIKNSIWRIKRLQRHEPEVFLSYVEMIKSTNVAALQVGERLFRPQRKILDISGRIEDRKKVSEGIRLRTQFLQQIEERIK